MLTQLHVLQFAKEEAQIFRLHVTGYDERKSLEDAGLVSFVFLCRNVPHLLELFLLDLIVLVEELKEVEALLDDFGIEGWPEEHSEDIVIDQPLFELFFFQPSIRYFHLGIRIRNTRPNLRNNHACAGEFLLKDWHLQAFQSKLKL